MHVLTKRSSRLAAFAIAVAVGAVPLAVSTGASAAGTETLTPSATDNLAGGQVITVDGTGFAPSPAQIAILECSSQTPDPAHPEQDCDVSNVVFAPTDADGSFSDVSFTLASGAVGTNGNFCPSKVAGEKCYLIAANPNDPTDAFAATLTFAPVISVTPSTDVASGDVLTVDGYGFPASKHAFLAECADPPTQTSCNGPGHAEVDTDSNGAFNDVPMTVTTGPWGNATAWCAAGDVCLVTATTDLSGTLPDEAGRTTFTFADEQQLTIVDTTIYRFADVNNGEVTVNGSIVDPSKAAGIKGLDLTLYQRAKGTTDWDKVTSKQSGTNGTYAFKHLKHHKHAWQYKVKHPKQLVGDTKYPKSASKAVTVK
jgi:hypothetical protein